jgi:hypothetical protein
MGQVKEGYDQQGNPKVAFSWFPKNPHSIEVPSIDILLSLKEELKITHKGWQILCEKLHLPTGCGLGAIRKEIEKKNETLGISESPSGKGHVACLKEYLSKVFLSKVKNPDDPVLLKFSFDGAKFSKRIKVVTGTFEVILADTTVSEAKSVVNCHQWLVFLGEEEREELELELEGVAKIVEETLTSKKFIAGEKTFTNVDVVLVCDLKIMLKICGFYSLYCSKTHWRCPWCRVTREQLAKFEIQSWPFRSLEEVKSKEGELRGLTRCTRQQKARINGGYNTYPIFKVSLEHWIPCSLHISMAITKLLLKCTIGNSGEVLGEKFKEVFNKLNIKLVDDKTDLTWKTFKRSRIGAVELLTIASNYSLFVQAWESFANGLPPDQREKKKCFIREVEKCWSLWLELLVILKSENRVSEKYWMEKSKNFALCFVKVFPTSKVTTYLHVLVYHTGYFIEKYGTLEKLANFAAESNHRKNKMENTNLLRHKEGNTITFQLLSKSMRKDTESLEEETSNPPKKRRKTWAEKEIKNKGIVIPEAETPSFWSAR